MPRDVEPSELYHEFVRTYRKLELKINWAPKTKAWPRSEGADYGDEQDLPDSKSIFKTFEVFCQRSPWLPIYSTKQDK